MKKLDYNDNKNIIFKQLKTARVNAGITQEELAAKMQTLNIRIDQQMISKIENNQRIVTDYELASFCKILKVNIKDMLSDYYKDGNQ